MTQFSPRRLFIKFSVIAVFLTMLTLSSCAGNIISFPVYLELNLNESRSTNPFFGKKQPLEIFNVIEKAANDKNVRGIILNISSISADRDHLWELREAIEQFKTSGKKVFAYIGYADMDVYLLASAADKIVMHELGALTMTGYSMGRGYMKQSMEKLGIGVRELRYFDYKTAAESFTRDSFSQADREQYNDYLDDVFTLTRDTLIKARKWTKEEFDDILNNGFYYSARSAMESGLVDYVGGSNEMNNAIFDAQTQDGEDYHTGILNTIKFALYGSSDTSLMNGVLPYTPPKASGKSPVIAVVYAEGETDMNSGIEAAKLSNIIREQASKKNVKAIVIRVNSPGGAADAADYINEAVRYAKIWKPVVVSMGSVAASGGYWMSMGASHIVANPYTITGSIGVIGTWFYDNGLNSKIGLNFDIIKRGAHSDLNTGFLIPYRNLTSQEEDRFKNYILDLYNIFIQKAANSRAMEIQDVEKAAQGRIFSGSRAMEAGLVDSLGGLSDAVKVARDKAGITEETSVRYKKYPEPKFFEKLMESFPSLSVFSGINKNSFISSDLLYRLERNGQVMPILPLDFYSGNVLP